MTDAKGIELERLRNRYVGKKEGLVFQQKLIRLLWSRRFNLVIAEFNVRILSNLLAFVLSRVLGIRFVWWGHGVSPTTGPVVRRLRLALAKAADAVIFYDEVQAEQFLRWGLSQHKIFVAPNAIDTEEIVNLRDCVRHPDRYHILYVGRLISDKKVALLIRALAIAGTRLDEQIELIIIGDGPERARLESLATRLGVAARVRFVGATYGAKQLAPWFCSAFVSVSPGYVGLSAIESLAFGLPMVVARDEPHSPEVSALKEGENALFFSSDNADELAGCLLRLAHDRSMQQRMAEAARATIDQGYSLDGMVDAFERAVAHAMS